MPFDTAYTHLSLSILAAERDSADEEAGAERMKLTAEESTKLEVILTLGGNS